MTTAKKLIAGASLATLAAFSAGFAQAAAEMTHEQITKQVLESHPGATVQHTRLEKYRNTEAWKVTFKDKAGKEMVLFYDAKTGKEIK